MDRIRAVNSTNVQSSRRVTFLHGQMHKTHRSEEGEEEEEVAVAQHLEAIIKIHLVIMEMILDKVCALPRTLFQLGFAVSISCNKMHFPLKISARKRKCGNCKQEGHTRVKCPRLNFQQ